MEYRRKPKLFAVTERDPRQFVVAGLVLVLLAAGAAVAQSSAPLADAVEKMNRAKVADLLQQGTDVNAAQADGMTALHWAVYHDDAPTTTLLLKAGAKAMAANRYAVTPLCLACSNGNTEIVELLLKAGADANTTLRGGETALMTAARTGKLGPVKALLARGADVKAKDRKGQTALMWAAADGHAEVVRALLDAGADFRTSLPSGFTPLLFAAREGRTEVVRVLLKAGADVNEASQPQKVPSRGARSGTSALLLAVENGHFELAIELMKAGADANDQRSGCAALHMISWVRKPNRGDSEDGDPPPIGSGKLTSLEFVKQIVALGAKVDLPQKKGVPGRGILGRIGATPLIAAASTSDVALVRTYLELGADPKLTNGDGTTPLLAAAGIGVGAPEEAAGSEPEALEVIEVLLKLGADPNVVDKNGENAMHGAAYRNHPKVVQLLADKGAKIDVWNRPNKVGLTPLVIAEGHRPGLNFRPSPPTVAAFHRVMLAAGVTPPKSSPLPINLLESEYGGKKKKRGPSAPSSREDEKSVNLLRTPHGGIQPQAVMDGRGVLHLLYFTGKPHAGDLCYVRRVPGKSEFSTPLRVNSQPESAIAAGTIRGGQLAVGKDGRVHVAWNGSGKAQPRPKAKYSAPMLYARLNDAGTGFDEQRNLMQRTDTLDGGGSVAADRHGNVYVAWHASRQGSTDGEEGRQVWLAVSRDEGKTFAAEEAINTKPTGACGCCGMKAFVDVAGNIYCSYRTALNGNQRDMFLLASSDKGKTFLGNLVHKWQINSCPMSSESFAEGADSLYVAWDTDGQVYFTPIKRGRADIGEPIAAPGTGTGRKHPALAVNGKGELLMAWTEGTGWQRGGTLAWQLFDAKGRPTTERGRVQDGIPVWGLPTVVAEKDGCFTIIH